MVDQRVPFPWRPFPGALCTGAGRAWKSGSLPDLSVGLTVHHVSKHCGSAKRSDKGPLPSLWAKGVQSGPFTGAATPLSQVLVPVRSENTKSSAFSPTSGCPLCTPSLAARSAARRLDALQQRPLWAVHWLTPRPLGTQPQAIRTELAQEP